MNKFDQLYNLIIEGQYHVKYPNIDKVRISKNREPLIKLLITKLEEAGKLNYLKKLYKNIKNLDQLNLNEDQINLLSDNVLKYLYQQFYNKFWSYPNLVNLIITNLQKNTNVLNIISLFNGDNPSSSCLEIRKNLLDILNSTLNIDEALKKVIIVKQNNKVSLYKFPFNETDKPIKGPYDIGNGSIITWLKENFIPKNRFKLEDEIEI